MLRAQITSKNTIAKMAIGFFCITLLKYKYEAQSKFSRQNKSYTHIIKANASNGKTININGFKVIASKSCPVKIKEKALVIPQLGQGKPVVLLNKHTCKLNVANSENTTQMMPTSNKILNKT